MNTYNIYPKNPGRKNSDPLLSLTLRAMNKGDYIFVSESKRTEVHSFKRSLTKDFSTKKMRDGKLKVLCTKSW